MLQLVTRNARNSLSSPSNLVDNAFVIECRVKKCFQAPHVTTELNLAPGLANKVKGVALKAVLVEVLPERAEPVGVPAAVVGLQRPGHVVGAASPPHRPGRRVGQSAGWRFNRLQKSQNWREM